MTTFDDFKEDIEKDRRHDTPLVDPNVDSELQRIFATGSHRASCVTVKCSNDLDELLWDAYTCWRMHHEAFLFTES